MKPIFFLIRLPVFLIGLALYAGLVTTLGGGIWLLWGMFLIFLLPFQFVGRLLHAAFTNDSRKLSDWTGPAASWNLWVEALSGYFSAYRDLFRWLAFGSE